MDTVVEHFLVSEDHHSSMTFYSFDLMLFLFFVYSLCPLGVAVETGSLQMTSPDVVGPTLAV